MPFLAGLNERIKGQPDAWLTWALILTGVALIMIALCAPRLVKAGALAWALFP